MRVLTTYYTHKRGGFCTRLYRMMNALAKAGNEVTYVVLDAPPQSALDPAVSIHLIPFFTKKRDGLFFWGAFTLWLPVFLLWTALQKKPDVFSLFGAYYSSAAYFASRIFRIKIILFLRSLSFKVDELDEKQNLARWFAKQHEKFGILAAHKLVCMTKAQQEEVENFISRKLVNTEILPNDLPQIARVLGIEKPERIRLVTTGVLTKRKNIDVLIEAVRELNDLELYIVGDGPERTRLNDLAKDLPQVRFTGWVDDPRALLQSAHLYVHPALHEGIPNSLLEALALGVPVIAADIPEMREVLGADLLFGSDSVESLYQKIQEFIQKPEKIIEGSLKATDKLVFDWDSRVRQIADPKETLGYARRFEAYNEKKSSDQVLKELREGEEDQMEDGENEKE